MDNEYIYYRDESTKQYPPLEACPPTMLNKILSLTKECPAHESTFNALANLCSHLDSIMDFVSEFKEHKNEAIDAIVMVLLEMKDKK